MKTESEIAEEITGAGINPPQCQNCGLKLAGEFCHGCGQSAAVDRYTFKSFAVEFYNSFSAVIFTDVARTFWALIVRPGGFLRDYLAGKRVGFTQPVRYFFYAFVLELTVRGILIWLTNDQQFADAGKFDLRHQIIDLVSTFFWGSLWWMFYRNSDLNFIEDAVCALYFIAQMNFYSVIFLLVSAPFTANRYLYWTLAIIELAITVGYSFYFARKLFREPFWKLVPIQIVLTILYVVFNLAFYLADEWLRRALPLGT
jgi:hypothetical protein